MPGGSGRSWSWPRGRVVTSSKKKHHPPGAVAKTPPPPARQSAGSVIKEWGTTRQWVIRVIAALAIIGGVTMTLIGADPDVLGGMGKLVLMVPGMAIVAGGFIAIVETTPYARSKRR